MQARHQACRPCSSASESGFGSGVGVGMSFPVFGGGGSGRYTASMDIVMHDGAKPQEDANAYDAFSVISRLQPKILAGGP